MCYDCKDELIQIVLCYIKKNSFLKKCYEQSSLLYKVALNLLKLSKLFVKCLIKTQTIQIYRNILIRDVSFDFKFFSLVSLNLFKTFTSVSL